MLRIKKNISVCPAPEFERTPFQRSRLKKVVQSIVDADGKKISERVTSVAVMEKIPDDEFFNKHVTADMFSIENMQKSGVELRPVLSPFFVASMDEKASLVQQVESFDLDSLVDVLPSQPIVSPSNEVKE